jgi:tetratricopeptide (TPR) repeat protein
MNRTVALFLALIFVLFFPTRSGTQTPAPHVEETTSRSAKNAPRVGPVFQQLFGTIPVSTRSEEARKFIELSLDKYENSLLDDAVVHAQHATEKDPQFALGYAMLAFASRRGTPNSAALAQAKSLLPNATPDEQLLIRWMTGIQDRDLLPAIMTMNDLLERFPKDKHILYLASEWLYFQQDYERARQMMESVHQLDPNFSPVLNRLGYAYIGTGDPNPAKAVAYLERYAQLQPGSPDPEDSLGEVLRFAGDDRGSLEHYGAALQIDPTFFNSQVGLGGTLTLMGDYQNARSEYDRAVKVAETPRAALHAEYQKALVYFWEGHPEEGRKALDELYEKSRQQKEPNSLFEIGFGRAMLAADFHTELDQLRALEVSLQNSIVGMSEADRNAARAGVLREQVRITASHDLPDAAQEAIVRLEEFATRSRDLLMEASYESARGYWLFSRGDFSNAADELATDSHSPLALQQLAIAQDKMGDAAAAAATRKVLKYQRAPIVEWYLITRGTEDGIR